jgi:catechol 2,3-dioxygenase-like lactoylglutathione lyase family enzyme
VSNPRLALVILAVRDLPAMNAFYTAALGWPHVVDTPVYVELQHADGLRLGLYADTHFAHNVGERPAPSVGLTRTELYLYCDDLAAAIERAQRAGARLLGPRALREWGDEAAYVADPEGNVVALARPA